MARPAGPGTLPKYTNPSKLPEPVEPTEVATPVAILMVLYES